MTQADNGQFGRAVGAGCGLTGPAEREGGKSVMGGNVREKGIFM